MQVPTSEMFQRRWREQTTPPCCPALHHTAHSPPPPAHRLPLPAEGSSDGDDTKGRGSQEFEGNKSSAAFITKPEDPAPTDSAPAQV